MELRRTNLDRADWWSPVSSWPAPSPGFPGLDPQAKLAWRHMLDVAGPPAPGCDQLEISIHAVTLGLAIGLSERATRRALKALREKGLIRIADRYKGDQAVKLHEPRKARLAWERELRLTSAPNFGQGELYSPEEPQSASEDSAGPGPEVIALPGAGAGEGGEAAAPLLASKAPADLAPNPPKGISIESISFSRASGILRAEKPNPMQVCQTADLASKAPEFTRAEWQAMSPRDREFWATTIARSREGEDDPQRLGIGQFTAALEKLQRTPAERAGEVERIAAKICKRLADPNFYAGFYRRIAYAAADEEGGFTERKLDAILDRLEAKARRETVNRGAYFMRSIQAVFRLAGLQLNDKARQR